MPGATQEARKRDAVAAGSFDAEALRFENGVALGSFLTCWNDVVGSQIDPLPG